MVRENGASVDSSPTLFGPMRSSYSPAILPRQLEAAWARSVGVMENCTNLSASANVAGKTSGPTAGLVPKAGGAPAGGCEGAGSWAFSVPAIVESATVLAARRSDDCLRNSRRVFFMESPRGILFHARCETGKYRLEWGYLYAI